MIKDIRTKAFVNVKTFLDLIKKNISIQLYYSNNIMRFCTKTVLVQKIFIAGRSYPSQLISNDKCVFKNKNGFLLI